MLEVADKKKRKIALSGLKGSLDAFVMLSYANKNDSGHHLVVLHDKEEAAFFHTDLQAISKDKEILFFPGSYRRPYEYEETENANILQRAEVLNKINTEKAKQIIVTYPEALSEKVINKKSLTSNTFKISKGEELDVEFFAEILTSFGFEKSDFVYEAGQFAIRGGIIDVYSYSADLPFRIDLFGDEVESLRMFDPETQLSESDLEQISIIPNVQTKLLEEKRESILAYLSDTTTVWLKDHEQLMDVLEEGFEKVCQKFDDIASSNEGESVLLKPEHLFVSKESFDADLQKVKRIDFGNRFSEEYEHEVEFDSSAQPSFNKNVEMLAKDLESHLHKGYSIWIVAEAPKQLERLESIFEEIDSGLRFQGANLGIRAGFVDHNIKVLCYTDHQIYERYHRFKTKEKHSKSKALTLKELRTLKTGDFVTHVDYGIGRFAGLEKVDVKGNKQEAIRLIYKDNDLLYVGLQSLHKVSKYSGKEGVPPAISKLGSAEWENKKKKVKKKVLDIAEDLINLYAERKASKGFAYSKDTFMQVELESSFLYEDTPDQSKATVDVKADMELTSPMDRLVCGDVGFGKTEIAIRAAFKAVADNKQVAVLVPTTILAMQHYRTFSERLKDFPVNVEYINRFKSTKQVKETLARVAEGDTQILIGTHRIVNKDVKFKDLGLMVIDEEQKFGVKVKEKLKELKVNVDSLTLTATPIPRTLHFSLMGARDLSIIATPPPNRQPVKTEIRTFNEEVIRDAVHYELRRGGQVFFVHNRISDIDAIASLIKRLVPDARVVTAHGQMEGSKLEKIMANFIDTEYDVLVSTNIIESGLDIPNANTIIINRAHMFGLSDLHQMRGRVGRSNKKAFCYLISPPVSTMTGDARKRLSTLEEFSDLGDGFKVAMRDLDIRGAGNLLGAEQSGFITDLGFEMYHKILDETVQELKQTKFKDLFSKELEEAKDAKPFVEDCVIETDMEILIPETYVSNISERLSLYTKLDRIKNEKDLLLFAKELEDRFGKMPEEVNDLMETLRLRWLAQNLGMEKLTLKNSVLKGYFVAANNEEFYASDVFGAVIKFAQSNPKLTKIKEHKQKLIMTIDNVNSVENALTILNSIIK
nr:transcription-repair coupling factor [Aureibacter tunicatorum]